MPRSNKEPTPERSDVEMEEEEEDDPELLTMVAAQLARAFGFSSHRV